MIGAFIYLVRTSTRNKVLSQLKRLKNPRYAVALLFGLGYFWLVFFRRSAPGTQAPNSILADAFATILPMSLLALAAYVWIFGTDRSALAFSQAEVSMLFTAPVSRRGLIIYKLVRAQTAVLTTSLIWTVVFRRGSAGLERGVSFWLLLSIISMHRLGAALVRESQRTHGLSGAKRHWPSLLVFGVAAAMIGSAFYSARATLRNASGYDEISTAIIAISQTVPMKWVLYPFHVAVAPVFAKSQAEWMAAAVAAFVLLLLHFAWVVRTDAAFEESAAEASVVLANRLAAIRSRGLGGTTTVSVKDRRRSIPLAPVGSPMVAILWKNYLWLLRTGQVRSFLMLPGLCIVVAIVFAGRSQTVEITVTVTALAVTIAMFFFGPLMVRNDLRNELGRVSTMKTLPLTGRDILFAEIASSASAVAIMQYLIFVSGVIAASFAGDTLPPLSVRAGLLVGGWSTFLGLNLANFSIHNGLALLFPAWVRVGDAGTSGIERMGQSMLTLVVTLTLLAIMCILPAVAGAFVYFSYSGLPFVAVGGAALVAGAVLAGESWAVSNALGGALDRLEPMSVA